MVRELHVYGSVVPLNARDPSKFQHQVGLAVLVKFFIVGEHYNDGDTTYIHILLCVTSELECFDWAMLICSGGDNESSWLQRATVTMVEWETSIARVLHGLGCSLGRPMCHKGHDTRPSFVAGDIQLYGHDRASNCLVQQSCVVYRDL